MAGDYAVTITASRTEIEPGELARRLAELLGRPAGDVQEAIEGGVAVLERGLSYREATEVQRQLGRRDVPSQVVSGQKLSGDEVSLETPGETADEGTADEETVDDETDESSIDDEPREVAADSAPDGAASPGETDEETDDETGSGAWGELFPDLADEEFGVEEPVGDSVDRGAGPNPSSLDEQPEEVVEPGADELADLEEELLRVGEETPRGDEVEASPGLDGGPVDDGDGQSEDEREVSGEDSGEFDPGKIRQAFAGGEEKPPYKPDGYDQRAPHIPLLAAFLSLIAPGAGQVYNGRPEKARRYGVTFFLLVPWFRAVRDGWRYGEEVRTYYKPRPEKGTGRRALMFGAKWWLVVLVLGIITATVTSEVMEYQEREAQRQADRTLRQMQMVADGDVAAGVDAARQSASEAATEMDEATMEAEYTMDDEERARRLFILGYHYCKGGEYELCDEMMSRVTSLASNNRDAYDIQTWANLRAQGVGEDREMPEVDGDVPTLERFEVELAAEGRELEDIDRQFGSWWDTEGREAVADDESEEGEEDDVEADDEDGFDQRYRDFEIGE